MSAVGIRPGVDSLEAVSGMEAALDPSYSSASLVEAIKQLALELAS